MKLSSTDQLIVVAYLAGIMGIGLAMKRRAAKGMSSYFLGGRRLPWWALAMSGSSSYFDITGTMWIGRCSDAVTSGVGMSSGSSTGRQNVVAAVLVVWRAWFCAGRSQ